jgi:hypothetical protein
MIQTSSSKISSGKEAYTKSPEVKVSRPFKVGIKFDSKSKAGLPRGHEDFTLSRSGHQVQASSSGDEKVSKDKLKHPRLHLISRIE